MSVEFPYGRLFVGWRKSDWSKCYYDPAIDLDRGEISIEKAPDLLLYDTPKAKESVRNPIVGEINWLPHFDYRNFEANDMRSRQHMQRWFLYRAWQHLKVKDAATLVEAIRENQFATGTMPRWESWVKFGNQWRGRNQRAPGDDGLSLFQKRWSLANLV